MPGIRIPYRLRLFPALLGLTASLVFCVAAAAEDFDPFQVNSGHWMSFERYDNNIKRKRPVGNEALDLAPAKVQPPALDASPDENEAAEAAMGTHIVNGQIVSLAPVVAAPTRPLDLPILPGFNRGFDIRVDSTSDNNASQPAQIVRTGDGQSDLHLQEQNWQDAAEAARQRADEKNGVNADVERLPLDVRMSFLPNPKITPVPSPERKPRPRLAEVPSLPKPAPEAPQTAECAAVDAYKKKQLEAIQSDRQTLQALQSAITDLGLQKQLNFMAGAQQSPALGAAPQNQPISTAPPTGTP